MKQNLILCPLAFELEAMLSRLREKEVAYSEGRVGSIKTYHVPRLNAVLALGGHGKTQFAIQTRFFIHHFGNIDSVFCVGSAGSIDKNVSVLDVVIAEKTIEHDFKLKFISRASPAFSGDLDLLAKFSKLKLDGFQIHFGILASGDEDIIDASRAKEIKEQTQAIAVAWEGAGGARACKFNSVSYLEARGITDLADSPIQSEFKKNLKLAMANLADLFLAEDAEIEWITRL